MAPKQLTRVEPAEINHVVETEAHAVQWLHEATGLEELSIAAQLGYHDGPVVPLEWQREAAIEVLGIEGESYSMTGAGVRLVGLLCSGR